MTQTLVKRLVERFDDSFFDTVFQNIADHWWNQTVVLSDIPGKTCEEIGSRSGIFLRRIIGLKLD